MATQDYWVFLLQHEGDRRWVPLDVSGMEVLEGRYRLIARSRCLNTDVEIRIVHTSHPRHPGESSHCRHQKRLAKTNEQGFLLVLPFTTLQPGTWEVFCIGRARDDTIGESWRHALQLQVHPLTLDAMPVSVETAGSAPDVSERTYDEVDTLLLDWVAPTVPADAIDEVEARHDALRDRAIASDIDHAFVDDEFVDDDFSVFEALFSATDDLLSVEALDDLSQLDAFLNSDMTATPDAVSQDDVDTLIDVDALTDVDTLIDVDALADVDTLSLAAEAVHPSERSQALELEATPALSLWGIGARTGATAAMTDLPLTEPVSPTLSDHTASITTAKITASPADVSALIDASDVLPVKAIDDRLALSITLEPSFYEFRRGEVLMVYGQAVSVTLPAVISQGELVVKLVNPQTAIQIAEYRQTLVQQAVPLPIAAPLGVQDTVDAQLLLGEVAILDAAGQILAQQSFTATAAVDELFAAIELVKTLPQVEQKTELPLPPVDFGFFNFIGHAPADAPALAPRKKRESMQEVELPNAAPAVTEVSPPGSVESSLEVADTEEHADTAPVVAAAPTEISTEISEADDRSIAPTIDRNLDADVAITTTLPTPALEAEITSTSGQPLPEDWFDLPMETAETTATEVAVAEAAVTAVAQAGIMHDRVTIDAAADTADLEAEPVPLINPDPAASEVVVDDLLEVIPTLRPNVPSNNPLLLPQEQPIPQPTIEILAGDELVSGQAVRVRVKLPNILTKLYVKLWINDCQTRTLLDGPHWLIDFMPNGRDELEAIMRLTLPFGSLKIQIAAIAVEAATKRESYRVLIEREVVPPNLNADTDELSFDEF
jgi:hypothetical protein